MAYLSPLFQSSLELFGHSIEHFNNGTEKDRKFVILHLANSIELIFKDLLLDLGESIFKNPKETITTTSCIKLLTEEKKIIIPNLNKLELLIDERNSLQHKYGFPNESTTVFYIEAAYTFFTSFLNQFYSLEIQEVLEKFVSKDDLETFMLKKAITTNCFNELTIVSKIHPMGAIFSAHDLIENEIREIDTLVFESIEPFIKSHLIRFFVKLHIKQNFFIINRQWPRMELFESYNIYVPNDFKTYYTRLKELKNQALKHHKEPNVTDVDKLINAAIKIDPCLKELKVKIKENPSGCKIILKDIPE